MLRYMRGLWARKSANPIAIRWPEMTSPSKKTCTSTSGDLRQLCDCELCKDLLIRSSQTGSNKKFTSPCRSPEIGCGLLLWYFGPGPPCPSAPVGRFREAHPSSFDDGYGLLAHAAISESPVLFEQPFHTGLLTVDALAKWRKHLFWSTWVLPGGIQINQGVDRVSISMQVPPGVKATSCPVLSVRRGRGLTVPYRRRYIEGLGTGSTGLTGPTEDGSLVLWRQY
ncbi:hypothetical protein DFH07DRAFT_939258 [Mycena maculata]|uniref:Uncharacterized protein n=1 Tax=Mycena maculata TaxID=230809 RepID=A0AAD7JJ63_9AGAR|nr:hypothetical protein DFH07DRAFT_939258 [Mycena maculata]